MDEVVLVAGVDASMAPTYGNGQINYGTDYYFNIAHNHLSEVKILFYEVVSRFSCFDTHPQAVSNRCRGLFNLYPFFVNICSF